MRYVDLTRQSKQGVNRSRAHCTARICNAAAAALSGQPEGHGFKTRPLCVAVLGKAMSITCGLRLDRTRFETMRTYKKSLIRF